MNMHFPILNAWQRTTHEEKVTLIIRAYEEGHRVPSSISRRLSACLCCDINREAISSVYRINRKNGGILKDYPFVLTSGPRGPIDIGEVERLWHLGLSASVIAKRLGVKMRQIYNLAETNRDRLPVRVAKTNIAGTMIMSPMAPALNKGERRPYPDRVTRITSLGYPVTMPRVSFIDGPAITAALEDKA